MWKTKHFILCNLIHGKVYNFEISLIKCFNFGLANNSYYLLKDKKIRSTLYTRR